MLSDGEWAQIADDVMHRTGLCPRGEEDEAVRWIAIRHGADHIHLVAMLARQDRTRPRIANERYRVRDACLAAEQRYGLRSTAPADRTAARPPSRAETGKAARHGRSEPPRITLRRHVATAAAAAASDHEFFARLDQAGILVRLRYSVTNPGQVTGYAVALPDDSTRNGEPVWYGGGKLAADLSWPRLAQRWTRPARRRDPTADRRRSRRPVGLRRPHHRRRHRADTVLHRRRQPGRRRRRRVRGIGRAAHGRRRAGQPRPAPGRRLVRARRPPAPRAHPRAHPGREPAPPRRPAHRRLRLPHPENAGSPPSCCWSASPPSPKPSPNSATPSSAPPRPPPPSALPSTCAPPPGQPRLPPGRRAGQPRPPRHPLRNPPGPSPLGPPDSPSWASPLRPAPARRYQAGPAPATRHRHADRRHRGHAAPPVSIATSRIPTVHRHRMAPWAGECR